MVRYVMQELDQEQPLFNQLSLANDLERSLIKGLILSQPSNYSGALESCSDVRIPGFVLQARRFIEGNAELDITLDDIQRAAGVSPQRLHTAFKQQFGLSPLGYLKRFRLEAVRASLLEARGAYNVSATALRWGFTHLGRFSDHYQRVFGESPSKTLARGRR
ncbi:Regulatory protein PchR [compost metagenome]